MNRLALLGSTLLLLSAAPSTSHAQLGFEWELGMAFVAKNNIRIPGDGGTLFSFKDDFDVQPNYAQRLRISYLLGSRHWLALLYAPLDIRADGAFAAPVLFQDVTFPAGEAIRGRYKFNSYRLTYRYRAVASSRFGLAIGASAKLRDAEISLQSTGDAAVESNVGFVPLLSAELRLRVSGVTGLLIDAEGLAAPQGRAEDVLIALEIEPAERFRFHAGYRVLEGGADNEKVYNFALIHYIVLGANLSF